VNYAFQQTSSISITSVMMMMMMMMQLVSETLACTIHLTRRLSAREEFIDKYCLLCLFRIDCHFAAVLKFCRILNKFESNNRKLLNWQWEEE
jgi:hypothetical protein